MRLTGKKKISGLTASLLLAALPCFSPAVNAALLGGGALTLNLDRNALIAGVGHNGVNLDNYPDYPTADFQICCRPAIYLEEFFDANAAATRSFIQLRDDNTPNLYDNVSDEISAQNLSFDINPATQPVNLAGRVNQATTLSFDPNDLQASVAGKIGFGGVMRFRVDVDPPTNRVIMGDFDLEYNPDLADRATGRSGWVLMNNIGFRISGFDLFDVSTQIQGNAFTMSGTLGLGQGFDHLGGITDTPVGNFSLTATVIPLPGGGSIFSIGCAVIAFAIRRKQAA